MKRIGLLGFGEIGQAIHKVYQASNVPHKIFVKDLVRDDGLNELDVLNVAIPNNDKFDFVEEVSNIATKSSSKIVIIHSTVPVGTTRTIKERLGPSVSVGHSPCRGVHPNLFEGIMTFIKFIGCTTQNDAELIDQHLTSLGIKTHVCKNSETSELSKLLDTTYYGICIAYHAEAERACNYFNADFEDVMTLYNKTYNEGYLILGKSNVIRPVLIPPRGGIGGHCVIQNAELLKKQFDSKALDLVLLHKKNNNE
jgi:UDP-N-acetyl-D-mannosaminuronate dehydrogenase